ncbi:dipeptide/oligopeptide/nickel ABC transporter permease/ATP-binding protein [Blastococcus saxobsidens]|uniref:Putative ABC transporter permease and ATP-binding protein n=1 Tax=Blastococcus saxobsidens (strain DD2) TaxID=1146883 RepID=H6RN67_BLASD|nr:dipeptide/oligopeptide/nickel ABC transporter permease/ATP-binding protein [Blastococcus saxobsidens]CCG02615.1 Putative ABC transporter permease and ATP-binding protein [Blastococcus saxobsidens DD2]
MTSVAVAPLPEAPVAAPRPTRGAVARFVRKPVPMLALLVIALMVLAVLFADLLAPYGPLDQDLQNTLAGPSSAHLLGTDSLGRDVLSRLLYGGRPALLGVVAGVATFLVTGVVLGVLAGYFGGWTDRVVSAVADALISVPGVILVLAVLAIFNQEITIAMAVFGFLASGVLIRIIRSSCLSLREELFVAAARVSGLSDLRIMARHILPGLIGPIVIQLSLFSGVALAVQTGLGFLGLGSLPPAPTWGAMVGEAAGIMTTQGSMLFITGGVIALLIIALGLFSDGVRDVTAESRKTARSRPARRRRADRAAAAATAAEIEKPPVDGVPLLEVENYSIGFDNGHSTVEVVKGVSFAIQPGEILGLVGESGSGKTVTALSVLGLLPGNGRVTSGDLRLHGRSTCGLDEQAYRSIRGRRIGLVSQEPMVALDPMFTVRSQLTEVLRNVTSLPRQALRAECVRLLERVRLPDVEAVLEMYPHQLSGGMAQRVVIAIALAGDPDLLIADEPTTALDVTVQAEILDLLRDLRARSGKAVLLVTHDLGVVADVCDRAVVMSRGEVVEVAAVDDLFYAPREQYTRRLIDSTPNLVAAP